mmetsp:Transcript_9508/g.17831  ORF Transcript_9508/g.17831 Transcript_9508/m.17831 type:complete len:85 (+) Transcript_9508:2404-2658(+)
MQILVLFECLRLQPVASDIARDSEDVHNNKYTILFFTLIVNVYQLHTIILSDFKVSWVREILRERRHSVSTRLVNLINSPRTIR